MPRFLGTWSFRLVLLYAGLFTVSAALLFGVIYWSVLGYAVQDQTDEINVEFRAIIDEAELAGYAQLPRIIEDHLSERAGTRVAYLLEDASGRKLAGNIEPIAPREGAMTANVFLNGKYRELQAHFYQLPNGDFLLIGEDSFALRELKELVARAFGLSAMATLLLAGIGGFIVGKSVLRRVESVASTSRAIIAGDLSQRVPDRGTDDEFDRLAASVNAMLNRIEDLMGSMRQVSNDIAHDLRTPLTRLRQRLERARRQNHSVEQLHDALAAATAQVDSILETFGALLRIAQIEAGQSAAAHRIIDLSATLTNIAEDFTPSAEDRGQVLVADIQPDLTVIADRELLIQMIVNLLENALRHAPSGALIELSATRVHDHLTISVADNGPGIPEAEREKVLRPFYRLESSRTTDGSGLGFSLVAAVAKRHGAMLTLADNGPGLRVEVSFSRTAAA